MRNPWADSLWIWALVALAPAAGAQEPTQGLAGHWRLDETAGYYAEDSSSAQQRLMIVENGVAQGPTMASHLQISSPLVPLVRFADPGSFAFSGGDDYLSTFPDFLSAVTNTFTIAFWAKPGATWAPNAESASGSIDINQQRLACSVPSGSSVPSAGVSVGTNGVCVIERNYSTFTTPLVCTMPLTGWTHVAVVYVDRRPSLYLNGVFARSGIQSQAGQVKVGGAFGCGATGYFHSGGWYEGLIDDIRVYSRALGDAEIGWLGSIPPPRPTALAQVDAGTASPLAPGATAGGADVVLKGIVHGSPPDVFHLEVEVRPAGTLFSGVATAIGVSLASDGQVATVTCPGLAFGTAFHWQARSVREPDGSSSSWLSFGTDPDLPGEVDFRIRDNHPPTTGSSGQNVAGTGLAAIPGVPFLDAAGVVLWAIIDDPDQDATRLEVEVRPVGQAFLGAATGVSPFLGGGAVARVPVSLPGGGSFHWSYRAVDRFGAAGAWSSFGGGSEASPDFTLLPLGSLGNAAACASRGGGHAGGAVALLLLAAAAVSRRSI